VLHDYRPAVRHPPRRRRLRTVARPQDRLPAATHKGAFSYWPCQSSHLRDQPDAVGPLHRVVSDGAAFLASHDFVTLTDASERTALNDLIYLTWEGFWSRHF
jgi:hypothetical protein